MINEPTETITPVDKNILDSPHLKEYLAVIRLLEKIENAPTHEKRVDAIRVFLLYVLIVPDYVAHSPSFRTRLTTVFMVSVRAIPELAALCSLVDDMLVTLPSRPDFITAS